MAAFYGTEPYKYAKTYNTNVQHILDTIQILYIATQCHNQYLHRILAILGSNIIQESLEIDVT